MSRDGVKVPETFGGDPISVSSNETNKNCGNL